ncbi:GGDEF domain-containing protein [Sporomusa termitida]|uniref:GGDEF: diguanylate cyclase (GGDEF) domain protein n=1 Tax=Sporomusa termitida TaxID=2377 RepID=A0A517E173_9FIRM|nr:GGDEF domain-containing protein [Sporomusa termitida]QDR83350.1 GGDEF: diguanylate cyclase (GGDEF) domain protein [Sporomusa termitida]
MPRKLLQLVKGLYNNIVAFNTPALPTGGLSFFSGTQPPRPDDTAADLKEELITIIKNKEIVPVYQPIVNLNTGRIMGFEALSRGPAGSPLHYPLELFRVAVDNGKLLVLEQICREAAVSHLTSLGRDQRLFLNMNAEVVKDPDFRGGLTKTLVIRQGLNPEQITFEITERTAITDFDSFSKSLSHYRAQGYSIAIDDAGAGYSSLQSIAELRPNYIKLDRSLVHDVDKDPLKQAMVDAMTRLAAVIHSKIIAEGIETADELAMLISKGVHYGQGFLLARPGLPPPEVSPAVLAIIAECNCRDVQTKSGSRKGLGVNIGEIVEQVPAIPPATVVSVVEEIFTQEHTSGIVIVDGDRPVGLLMKDKLYYQLGTNYGISLYHRRPVERVMDKHPLIVNAELPLEAVSQMAMIREASHLYDFIIVVRDGIFWGVVSIMSLLNKITNLQIRRAHNSNPLTGLPGNWVIEDRLKELVETSEPFAVMYLDLDNFKAYNDKYGFERGDKVLLLTAQVLSRSIGKSGSVDDFLGHIGGDDFILITKPDNVPSLAASIIGLFDREIKGQYHAADLSKGYLEIKNRKGQPEHFPIMSISIAVVSNRLHKFTNYLEIAEAAAELKKLAKQQTGSCLVCDRRRAATQTKPHID